VTPAGEPRSEYSVNNIIESGFQQLKKCFTGDAALAQCALKNPTELSLE
jgi:hypothetical protein